MKGHDQIKGPSQISFIVIQTAKCCGVKSVSSQMALLLGLCDQRMMSHGCQKSADCTQALLSSLEINVNMEIAERCQIIF